MKHLLISVALGLTLTACTSNSGARTQAEQRAFAAGRQQALLEQQQKNEPVIWFRGEVRQARVPWIEGITLAEALATAQYTGNRDPRLITVTRAGQAYSIRPNLLLRGEDNPALEPGDIVELRR